MLCEVKVSLPLCTVFSSFFINIFYEKFQTGSKFIYIYILYLFITYSPLYPSRNLFFFF